MPVRDLNVRIKDDNHKKKAIAPCFFFLFSSFYLLKQPRSSPSTEISHVHYPSPLLYLYLSRARKHTEKKT
ncbi:hypothetical protein GHT06_014404 [Daphnia sinensis]|uniref:Uncharacterized protein n=1 Tax=Daphnia sinensis TaxID=1820382 RepID=A0AAD5PV64_9CRUS|nr:hypothetical protein GHT06_014404 [Daphnia sinensis]